MGNEFSCTACLEKSQRLRSTQQESGICQVSCQDCDSIYVYDDQVTNIIIIIIIIKYEYKEKEVKEDLGKK